MSTYLQDLTVRLATGVSLLPAELRRRNLIAEAELPYTSPLGYTIDSGRFADSLTLAETEAELNTFPARRQVPILSVCNHHVRHLA